MTNNEQSIVKLRITRIINTYFGNHDYLQKFIDYHKAVDKSELFPPFQPILYRTVNSAHPNHKEINSKSLHKTLLKYSLLPEIHKKFCDYEQFRNNCLLYKEFIVITIKKLPTDTHKIIRYFLF